MRKLNEQQSEEYDQLTEQYHGKLEQAAQARADNETADVDGFVEEAVKLARQGAEISRELFDEPLVRDNIGENIHERAGAIRNAKQVARPTS